MLNHASRAIGACRGSTGMRAVVPTMVLPTRPMQAARRLRVVPAVAAPTQDSETSPAAAAAPPTTTQDSGMAAAAPAAAPSQDSETLDLPDVAPIVLTQAILKELNKFSRSTNKGNKRGEATLATLCQHATSSLQATGAELPSMEFSFLGSSLGQASVVLAGTKHAAVVAPLAEASIAAALQATAMATASVDEWTALLTGIVKTGVYNQGLTDLMARAQHTITTSGGFATASGRTCGDMAWTLGRLGYSVDQPDTAAVLTQLVQAVTTGDAMATARLQSWAQLLSGLARCGCSVDPSSPAGAAVDVRAVAAVAVAAVKATTFSGPDALYASKIIHALATLGCSGAVGSQPDMTPIVASIVKQVLADTRRKEVPQVVTNLLTALVKSGADKATAQPALDQLVPLFTSKVQAGQCSGEQLSHVVDALAHYGVEADKEVLMKGMATPAPSAAE